MLIEVESVCDDFDLLVKGRGFFICTAHSGEVDCPKIRHEHRRVEQIGEVEEVHLSAGRGVRKPVNWHLHRIKSLSKIFGPELGISKQKLVPFFVCHLC